MPTPIFIFTLIISFITSMMIVRWFLYYARVKNLIDHPNDRSSHKMPTPVGAGIVFVGIWIISICIGISLHWIPYQLGLIFLPGALTVALIGYLDDHINLPADWRMTFYILASIWGVLILGGVKQTNIGLVIVPLYWLGSILAIFAMTWSINLFNFMDGTDGFAGVEAMFIFGVGGYLLWQAGGMVLACLAWLLAATVAGFLIWNWPKAKIFMGDVGSVFLGFLVTEFAFVGEKWHGVPALLWLMLYSVFYFDATVTLLRRMFAGERWYRAHRLHAFQRLHQAGWSHKKLLFGLIVTNVVLSAMVLIANAHRSALLWLFLSSVIFMIILYVIIERKRPMFLHRNR